MENNLTQKVAIIIPARNSGMWLLLTLDSIFRHTSYPHYRIIVIESSSTDGTEKALDELANESNNRFKVIHTKMKGVTKALNICIKETAEDEDIFLTQDDVIFPKLEGKDWLTEMVKLSKNKDCGLVTSANGMGVSGKTHIKDFVWVGTWSMYIPRKTINKIGLFDENFHPGPSDDLDFSYRVYKAGLKYYLTPFTIYHHRKLDFYGHTYENETIKKEHADYFRKKWGIKDE